MLKINSDAIKKIGGESVINNINTFYDNSAFNFQCTINPIEKWIEALDENKKLYELLLQLEKEKAEMLQELLKERK